MNKPPPPLINHHRAARALRWAAAMLIWLAMVLFEDKIANRRHIRRYRFASLHGLTRLLCSLALVRGLEISGVKPKPAQRVRNTAPTGFHRRIDRPGLMRAMLGSRLRKALRARTLRERIARLINAFADLDAFARRYTAPRALRRLTKLCAIIMRAPPAQAVVSTAAPTPLCADTS